MASAASQSRIDEARAAATAEEKLVTRAAVEDAIMRVARGVMIAVVSLIVLGELYATAVVATPWTTSNPTGDFNETHTVNQNDLVSLNASADYYYDNGSHAETITNTSSGATLTEGTDYEFYTNGTVRILSSTNSVGSVWRFEYSAYSKNSWHTMTSTFANYGTTSYTMIGLGLIALGASTALAYFGSFRSGGGGR